MQPIVSLEKEKGRQQPSNLVSSDNRVIITLSFHKHLQRATRDQAVAEKITQTPAGQGQQRRGEKETAGISK